MTRVKEPGFGVHERAASGDSGVGDDDVDPPKGVAHTRGNVGERAVVGHVNFPPAGLRSA